jgi:putative membrane protein
VSYEPLAGETWHRLHPLSPVVRSGRGLLAVLALIAFSTSQGLGSGGSHIYEIAVPMAAAIAAVVNWLVTRWRLDGPTLRIETGLLRRDSRQLPVARIQAVDVVRPFLARALGLAELRVRLAGSSHADGRLAYLPEQAALELRARLLAAHHGLDPATPEPAERVLVTVPNGRLVGSVVLSSASLVILLMLAEVVVALEVPQARAAFGGTLTLLVWLIALGPLVWRRLASQYGFTVAESPDGIRIRRGLLSTVAETIPSRRVQAVRMVEPLLWRPLGWCRLEIDVAGSPGRDRADGSRRMRMILLPVGGKDVGRQLMRTVLGAREPGLQRPPRRARGKAPLSYHFLASGHDAATAMAVTGRLRKFTTWLPLEKAQSVRLVEGPVQRRLGLATVHVDAAGRDVRAEFRDRRGDEARRLVDELATLSRSARQRVPETGVRTEHEHGISSAGEQLSAERAFPAGS